MKAVLLLICMLCCQAGKGQPGSEPDKDFPWQEEENYWQNISNNSDYQQYYQGGSPEEMMKKAMEHAMQNGLTPENMDDFLQKLADDLADNLLNSFEEAVLEQLMQEIGIARQLDRSYEEILKSALPKAGGIPVHDPGLQPAISKGNTAQNLKAMLKMAMEKWLNQQWQKQAAGIYSIQRENLEYRKKTGLTGLLKMAALEYEHFLSLEIMLPEQVLDYAAQLQQIYQSADESLVKGAALFSTFNISATDLELPQQMEKLQLLETGSGQARMNSWEMINQRRKALALAYLQLAERAEQKGKDLQRAVKTDEYLKMSDSDRLKAQQIVHAYMEDYFRYKEKADLLLQASLHNTGVEQKELYMARYQQALRLKNLAP